MAGGTIPGMRDLSDEDLVAHSSLAGISPERRREILNELFSRYHSKVAAWCYRSTGDRETAADLAQDVFLRAWKNLESWRGQAKFSTWLYTITRNHCINHAAAKAVRPEGASNSLDFEPLDTAAPGLHRQLELESEIRQMKQLIQDNLDSTETQVMTMHYGDEIPLDTITRQLSLTNASGAKAYIVSSRRKLKAAAERLGYSSRKGGGANG